MESWVSTSALPCAGITFFSALYCISQSNYYVCLLNARYLYKSYPAAKFDPLVGILALSESLLTSNCSVGADASLSALSDTDILRFLSCGESIPIMLLIMLQLCFIKEKRVTRRVGCIFLSFKSVSTPPLLPSWTLVTVKRTTGTVQHYGLVATRTPHHILLCAK